MNPAAAQMILQSQALMMQMLDLQKWQQQVALRFVESHQQLVQNVATAGPLPTMLPMMAMTGLPMPQAAPAAEVAHAATVSAPVQAPVPAPLSAAPAPVVAAPAAKPAPVALAAAPKPVTVAAPAKPAVNRLTPTPVQRPEPATNGVNGSHPAVPQPHVAVVAKVAPAPMTAPTSNDEGIPTPDEFKTDLLDAVSERTGYPIEMLDLELAMEAGLGIDSIKTVEIFSNLKKYHAYFQQEDQDEEEALKEFTKLKTLGDIISAYELRYQAVTSSGPAPKIAQNPDVAVERYSLEAVEAPTTNGQKKTTLVNS